MSQCPSIGCKCIHIHMESAATVFSSRMKRRVRNAAIVEVVAPLLQELYFGTCSSPLERGTDGTNENCFGFARRVLHQALGLDVEADNQAHRSKSSKDARMVACLHFAHMVCSAVSHAREVKKSSVSGSKLQGGMFRRSHSFSAKDTCMKPLQKKVRKATATIVF